MGLFDQFPYTNVHELNLQWILQHFTEFIKAIDDLEDWRGQHEKEYEELKKLYDDMYNGTLSPALEESLRIWINHNLEALIGEAIKTVHFGLTNDGYFCAWIPSSWSDVQFDTVTDFDDPLYGHLVLMYD